MPKTFTVSKDYNNCRFDRWFKLNIGKYPQSLIERLIRKKKIKVNKKRIKTSYRVKLNDKIDIYEIDNLKPSKSNKKERLLVDILHGNKQEIIKRTDSPYSQC